MHRFVNSTLHTSGQFAIRVVFLILAGAGRAEHRARPRHPARRVHRGHRVAPDHARRGRVRPRGRREQGRGRRVRIPRAGLLHLHGSDVRSGRASRPDPILFALVPLVLVAAVPRSAASRRCSRRPSGRLGATGSRSRSSGRPGCRSSSRSPAIGVDEGILSTADAAVLVGAGMLSVLLFPLIAMSLRGERSVAASAPLEDDLA